MQNYIVMPLGVHVSQNMQVTIVVPKLVSLHDLVYGSHSAPGFDEGLALITKINILIQLARVLNQFHNLAAPIPHGNLNSHNVFVEFANDSV